MSGNGNYDISGDDDSEVSGNNNEHDLPLNKISDVEKKYYVRRSILAQTLMTGAVMLAAASCGMPIGYSAILLPQLKNSNSTMTIDDEIGSWIASVHSAATPFGSLLSGVLMDRFGRKLALQIASFPLIVGWIFIGFASNHAVLLVGRIVAGLSAGLTAAAGQVMIGEISEPHLRGIFTSVPFASYSFGILLVYALGSLLTWRYVAGLSTVLPILSIVVFFFLPESPVWLARQGQSGEAKKALTWLRGGNLSLAKEETKALMKRVEQDNSKSGTKSSFRIFLEPQIFKPMIIVNIFNILQVCSGTYLIVFYAVDILNQMKNQKMDSFLTAVLTACVRFIFTLVSSLLLALIGRRTLAMTSGIGTTISSFCLAAFLLSNCQLNGYFSAVCILFYVAFNTLGFMILPGVMVGELYPARVRGLAGGVTFMLFNLLLFITAKVFPYLRALVGVHGIFSIFGVSSLLASLFVYLLLPETKGKSLNEIEDYFHQPNVMWINRVNNKKENIKETESMIV